MQETIQKTIKKLNESFSLIDILNQNELKKLSIKKDIRYNIWAQINDKYTYELFYKQVKEGFIVPNGVLEYLGLELKPIKSEKLNSQLDIILDKLKPFKLYDYQEEAIKDAIQYKRLFIRAATGAGKSVIIGLISKILTLKKLKGLILVPNISLTNQFENDLKSYNLNIDTRLIGGENNIKSFDKPLTISTWQSVRLFKDYLKELDFIIVDEAHTAKSDEVFDICNQCINATYKIGLSGTLPEGDINAMRIISIFGLPITYITPRGLIERGLATNARINIIDLKYNFVLDGEYSSQLKKLKEYSPRNFLICNLTERIKNKGNTLVLFQHTEHGLQLLYGICKLRKLEYDKKTYKDLVWQKINNLYFVNGLIEGKQREIIRNILENNNNSVVIANFAVMSTGINIRNLHNLILASPLKSYVTITQSIGRLLRLHENKDLVNIYDIADHIGFFKRQINLRINNSYRPEGYEIQRIEYQI